MNFTAIIMETNAEVCISLIQKKSICRKITVGKCFIFSILSTISKQYDSYFETV